MIEIQDMYGRTWQVQVRDGGVYFDQARIVYLSERSPGIVDLDVSLVSQPVRLYTDVLHQLGPIAQHLPGASRCINCGRTLINLTQRSFDEPWCVECTAQEARESAAWDAQRTRERLPYRFR